MPSIGRLFREHAFRPRRSRGQNFLVDQGILDRIERAVECPEGDILLEVGGGYGVLTERLLKKSRPLVVVESDRKLFSMLEKRFMTATAFQPLKADILQVDLAAYAPLAPGKLTVVGNIPYYLTTPLITRLLEDYGNVIRSIYLMVQREIADRLQADPGTKAYGALTVCARYYSDIDVLFPVPAESFKPKPKVESAFIRIRPREERRLPPEGEKRLFQMTRAIFQSRRKTLRNSLKLLGLPSSRIDQALVSVGVDPEIRGETLDLESMIRLSQTLG